MMPNIIAEDNEVRKSKNLAVFIKKSKNELFERYKEEKNLNSVLETI